VYTFTEIFFNKDGYTVFIFKHVFVSKYYTSNLKYCFNEQDIYENGSLIVFLYYLSQHLCHKSIHIVKTFNFH